MNWRPIETAPRDGAEILLLTPEGVIEGAWSSPMDEWEVVWLDLHGCGCCSSGTAQPTHWMPLPDPPEPTEAKP